ncbi:MAG: 5-dehydro-4-deoxy-D-glucuronate isomerase [Bacteroidales bacterium]|nr:5-dehydro-4-deoxy-D-glucuronate isomerase [Bacteroidales bacterium]
MKTNTQLRYASNPQDVNNYDTDRIRQEYLIQKLFIPEQVNMTYSLFDRMIIGGAMPIEENLTLETIDYLKSNYFLERREIGIYNVGGAGIIDIDGKQYNLDYKEAIYIGMGAKKVVFISREKANPSKFYFNSTPAHISYPIQKVLKANAISVTMGSLETSNERTINKMIVNQILKTCQLQMGMTELKQGSVWNTFPPHTHTRRMEAYFYFELPEDNAICHFMGEPTQTKHIWLENEQAVISPEWSIHSACGTHNYTFIWGMAGENLDYGDQDFFKATELR